MHIKTAKICFINFEILQSTGLFICIFQKSLKVFGAVSVNALLSTANRNSQCSIQLYKERIRVLHCEWMLSAGSIVNSTFAWWLYKYYWPTFNAGRCPTKIKGLNCHMQTIAKDTHVHACSVWRAGIIYTYSLTSRLCFPLSAPIPQFFSSNPISYEKDSYVAHKMSAIAHLTVRYVTLSIQEQELMQLAEISLR